MQNITPYIQINPYKETLKQAEDFTALLPEDKRTTTKRLSLEDAINCVHGLDHTLGQLNQERTELEAKKKDLMEKAKETKNPKELLALAKEADIEMSPQEAEENFALLNKKGELSDEELDNVAGGGCDTTVDGKSYTVVSSGLNCFTGQYEATIVSPPSAS